MAVNFNELEISTVPENPPLMTPEKVFEVVDLITKLRGREQFLEACHAHGFALNVPPGDIAFIKQAVLDIARANDERAQGFSVEIQAIVRSYPTCT
ncbi:MULTISPECIES: hypothetical protein [unclassified Mesorhizobium]|uniref:hypothetical protein n=1 Tax=unclassified Mesorhizobium TaxID=325217 RepID=UPI00112AF04D|nr:MULTISPECIES: hypothetical protein [unclassified Mesorhizobium]TPK42294.1 hypothetical protein FJ550_30120 [Mesorhizobium sp. B2-5-2]TPL44511.1 hypothetical protein FJ961_04020 [Mesorhizobium sp. B2-4-5]TPM68698.1 hypothetical protein FJ968_29825 [Mesorhizobium sp. B2-1-6]TPN71742.1 hypothetical protein FJ985_30625 [Mesorhizobium sp. B1-1-2]